MDFLNQLLGGNDPTKQQAMAAFAQGLLRGDFAGGLLGSSQVFADAPAKKRAEEDAMLKRGLLSAQIDETKAQAEERRGKMAAAQQAQERRNQMLFGGGDQGGGAGFMPSESGPATGGLPPGGIMGLAKQLGIDPRVIQADIEFNGGKKVAEFMEQRGRPDMQVTNGYAYDKNRLGAGFMPSLSTSQDGKTAMTRIGPDGMPFVSAPQGALDTFNGYQRAQQKAQADYDPFIVPAQAGNPSPTLTTRGAFVASQNPGGNLSRQSDMPGAIAGPMGADPAAIKREITAASRDLMKPMDPASRAALQAHIQDLTKTLNTIGAPGPVGGIALQSEAEKIAAARGAEGAADRKNAETAKSGQFKDFRDQLNVAKTLLEAGPTNSTVGAGVDSALGAIGVSTTGANVARSLETASKWLTQNIPKAPGAQSDAELKEYAGATGLVGDRTVPVAQRLAALDTVNKLLNTWEQRRSGKNTSPTVGMVQDGYKFKGGNPADPASWEKQ